VTLKATEEKEREFARIAAELEAAEEKKSAQGSSEDPFVVAEYQRQIDLVPEEEKRVAEEAARAAMRALEGDDPRMGIPGNIFPLADLIPILKPPSWVLDPRPVQLDKVNLLYRLSEDVTLNITYTLTGKVEWELLYQSYFFPKPQRWDATAITTYEGPYVKYRGNDMYQDQLIDSMLGICPSSDVNRIFYAAATVAGLEGFPRRKQFVLSDVEPARNWIEVDSGVEANTRTFQCDYHGDLRVKFRETVKNGRPILMWSANKLFPKYDTWLPMILYPHPGQLMVDLARAATYRRQWDIDVVYGYELHTKALAGIKDLRKEREKDYEVQRKQYEETVKASLRASEAGLDAQEQQFEESLKQQDASYDAMHEQHALQIQKIESMYLPIINNTNMTKEMRDSYQIQLEASKRALEQQLEYMLSSQKQSQAGAESTRAHFAAQRQQIRQSFEAQLTTFDRKFQEANATILGAKYRELRSKFAAEIQAAKEAEERANALAGVQLDPREKAAKAYAEAEAKAEKTIKDAKAHAEKMRAEAKEKLAEAKVAAAAEAAKQRAKIEAEKDRAPMRGIAREVIFPVPKLTPGEIREFSVKSVLADDVLFFDRYCFFFSCS
jgi:hypothetical protein